MKIAVLPGDGIGPEIVAQAVSVLNALDEKFEMETAPVGGAGYEAAGHPLPEATLKLAQEADAVLFGAVGDWKYDTLERALRPEQAILGLRKNLKLFANLRPAILYPELAGASTLKPVVPTTACTPLCAHHCRFSRAASSTVKSTMTSACSSAAAVIAPATADLMSRIVHGGAPDALTGLVLLLIGSLTVILLQGAYVTGGGWGDIGKWSLVNEVMRTRVGGAIIARIVLVLLWVLVVRSLRTSQWTSVTSLVVWLLTVLMAVTFSVSGHPSADTLTGIFVPVDIAHLVGIAVWVGGLFSIVLLRREVDGNDLVAPAIARFSRNATWAMPLVIITGVAQTLHLTDGVSTLVDSGYGRFIIAKLGLVIVAVVLGTRARRSLAARGTASILSLVRVEAAIALVVLALSAALVSTSPNASNQQVPTFTASLAQRNIIAEITISPARVGESEIHALFSPPGGAITPVKAVKVRMELPAKNVPAIPVEMIQLGANHWSGIVQFPYSGDWSLEVLVTPSDNAQIRFSTVVSIRG